MKEYVEERLVAKKKLQRGHFVEYFNIVFVSIGKEYTYRSIVKHTTNR